MTKPQMAGWAEQSAVAFAGFNRRDVARFLAKVDAEGPCWLWTGCVETNGYGRFLHRGKKTLAHRTVLHMLAGPIATGLVVDHLCRVRRCVNPDHLDIVSQQVNIKRGHTGYRNQLRCPNGHLKNEENIGRSANGRGFWCRPCCKERWHAKKKPVNTGYSSYWDQVD